MKEFQNISKFIRMSVTHISSSVEISKVDYEFRNYERITYGMLLHTSTHLVLGKINCSSKEYP